jgi:hypothetical protein
MEHGIFESNNIIKCSMLSSEIKLIEGEEKIVEKKEKSIEEEFLECAENIRNIKRAPTSDQLLLLYGLYKQATIGDCNKEKPSFFNFNEGL